MDEADVFEAIGTGAGERLAELLTVDAALAGARDQAGVSAVRMTLYHRRPELTEILLAKDPPLDAYDTASLGRVEELREQLRSDPGLIGAASGDDYTLLHLAAFFGHAEAVELLLESGADANAVSNNAGLRPLHSAAATCSVAAVRLLLRAGADVNATQAGGWTALHAAAKHGDAEMVKLLLEHGADRDQATDDGSTARDLAENADLFG